MTYERPAFFALIVLLVLGTMGFMVITEPEDSRVVSADGAMFVAGVARDSQPLSVSMGEPVSAPLFGQGYQVAPLNIQLDSPVTIGFIVPTELQGKTLSIFRYQPKISMWEPVSSTTATAPALATVKVETLGQFALGEAQVVSAPDFLAAEDQLRLLAPSNTVGYEIAIGYYRDDGERIRLPDLGQTGGCGGQMLPGDGTARSEITRQVQVSVDDVLTTLNFVFVGSWITSSVGGCSETVPLMPFSPVL